MEDSSIDRHQLTTYLRWLVDREGAIPAARRVGIARGTLAALVAGMPANASTWAAVELRYRMLPEAERQGLQAWFDSHHRRVPLMNGTGTML